MRDNGSPAHLPGDYLNFRALLQARMAAQQHQLRPAGAQLVLEHIAGATNGSPAYPSYETLGRATNLSAYQVRRYVDVLVEQGYLTETRTARAGGGWGKPQWALGPRCQVLPEPHMSQGQVWAEPQSSVAPPTLASVARPTPKRESSTTAAAVGVSNDGGRTAAVVKRSTEEKRGKHPTQVRVGDMIDALRAVGLSSELTAPERSALLASSIPAAEIAACMKAVAEHQLGDKWDFDHNTVNTSIKLHRGWKTRQNGAPAQASRVLDEGERWAAKMTDKENARDARRVHPALPAP